MHFWQESSCRLHLRTTAAEHRAAEAGAGARLLLLLPRAPLAALPPLPLSLPPLLSERLRLWLGAEPWLPSSAGRPLGRAEEELAPFRVSVAPASPFSPPAAGVPRPLVPVVAALVLLLALVPLCGVLLPPALASACRKPQLCPRGQKPSFEKTTHGCAELQPPVPPLLPVEPKLLAVALLARAAAAAAADPCLVEAREPWPGSEEQRPPLAGAGGRLADGPWLLPAPPVLLLQAAAAAALVSC